MEKNQQKTRELRHNPSQHLNPYSLSEAPHQGYHSPISKKHTGFRPCQSKDKSPFSALQEVLTPLPAPFKNLRPELLNTTVRGIVTYKTPERYHLTAPPASLNYSFCQELDFEVLNSRPCKHSPSKDSCSDQDSGSQMISGSFESQKSTPNPVVPFQAPEAMGDIQPIKQNKKVAATVAGPQQSEDQSRHSSHQSENKKLCCNCKKSRCLKLYCDCFRNNKVCEGCNCVACLNTADNQDQRYNAMLSLIQRNPDAFKPKIEVEKHTKGCNCKKSNCLKKYCECYQAGLKCNDLCKCQQCKNCKQVKQNSNGKSRMKNTIKKQGRFPDWTKSEQIY